jgi:LmbE family N-acetylglucosaminyl deacetylase
MQSVASLGKIIVISPHLDDAVFACAGLIAGKPGTVVVTIFAGMPSDFAAYTSWDAASGFDSARQAVACRRDEDRNALEILDAMPLWLDFLDSQYGCTPTVDSVADILKEILRQHDPDTVMIPAGLFHSDHQPAHYAALAARTCYPEKNWFSYEDAFYRRIPGLLQQRLVTLAVANIIATPAAFGTTDRTERKHHAVQCYASQLQALAACHQTAYADVLAPERYWGLMSHPTSSMSLSGDRQNDSAR